MGRASGEHRVEKAIMNALDSPLLYGNDIGKAKRILFNIYASDEYPIFVRELQEIDDFFDELDPNIEVIWGTATDDSLGEDAKVTILATGMEDRLKKEVQMDVHANEDAYYEDIIKGLYRPVVVKRPTMANAITQTELEFKVEPAEEPEPAVVTPVCEPQPKPQLESEPETQIEPESEPLPESDLSSEPDPDTELTILDKWRTWLNGFVKTVTE